MAGCFEGKAKKRKNKERKDSKNTAKFIFDKATELRVLLTALNSWLPSRLTKEENF